MANYLSLTSWFKELPVYWPFIREALQMPFQEFSVCLNENVKTSIGKRVPLDRLTNHTLYL